MNHPFEIICTHFKSKNKPFISYVSYSYPSHDGKEIGGIATCSVCEKVAKLRVQIDLDSGKQFGLNKFLFPSP
jgi:hypothetical protein